MRDTNIEHNAALETAGPRALAALDLEQSVGNALESRMEQFAGRVAIDVDGIEITFRALNQRANRLANWILAKNPNCMAPIALVLDPGVSFIVAVLGVAKAGRCLVGLDVRHPAERNRQILEEVSPGLCLTDDTLASDADAMMSDGVVIQNIDRLDGAVGSQDPIIEVDPKSLLQIAFTTGSTGRPKGVVHSHRSILWRAKISGRAYGATPGDRIALLRPAATSPAVRLTLTALLHGVTICIWNTQARGTAGLARWLNESAISLCVIPVNLMRRCLATEDPGTYVPTVRFLNLTSDGVTATDVALCKERFPNAERFMHNISGNEAGHFQIFLFDRSSPLPAGPLPVGYPVEGCAVELWNEDGTKTARGEIGEIVVKSRYLAPGYWNQPVLTRQKFVGPDDPTAERTYRTGDLGRMDDDGCLFHLGRNDDRARIFGNRVEIGEVEAALLAIDGIDETAVVVQDDPEVSDGKRLTAFYVGSDKAPQAGAIRHLLARNMTRAMIPTRLIRLEAIPRGPTGKIDRKSLASAVGTRDQAQPGTPPCDALERRLTTILEEQFQVAPIGMDADLFALGADSLTAIEILVAIERELGVAVPVETLWSRVETVADLASVLREAPDRRDGPAPRLRAAPRVGRVRSEPLFTRRDIGQSGLLMVLLAIRHAVPARHWRTASRLLARLITRACPRWTRSTLRALDAVSGTRYPTLANRALADEIQAVNIETRLLSLGGWPAEDDAYPLVLDGKEHLDQALARGNGVILWRAPLTPCGLALSTALHDNGYTLHRVARPEHGFSRSRFGRRLLNRFIRNPAGRDQDRIVIREDGQTAISRIQRVLAGNGIVGINAEGLTDAPAVMPFLDGRLKLATGAPRLALATGAALLPVFTHRAEDGALHVTIEPAFAAPPAADPRFAVEHLLRMLTGRIETYVVADPSQWSSWRRCATGTGTLAGEQGRSGIGL